MRTSMRIASIASCVAVAGLLGACTTTRTVAYTVPVPVATAPAVVATPAVVTSPLAAVEYGRITNIQYFPGGTAASRLNVPGAIVGGVAGALIGNQVGRGHGREAATALGAVVGAFTGDRMANADETYQEVPREVTSCRTVSEVQTRVSGYRVEYEYHGQFYTAMLHDRPGPDLQVRVSVDPVGR